MRICYVLLSPTFGMHQYTADLANRMSEEGHDIHLVTTTRVVRDRYAPDIAIHTPVTTTNTGMSAEGLRLRDLREVTLAISDSQPGLVHFTGPHLWNVPLVRSLTARGIPVVHTLHDLDPHYGTRYGTFLRVWNRLIIRSANHVLIHGYTYLERLCAMGVPRTRITFTPLLHLFLGWDQIAPRRESADRIEYEPWVLFFGRLERYKGVDYLLTALTMMNGSENGFPKAVLAGPGDLKDLWADPLPDDVELHTGVVDDEEAIDLFRRCGLLVLPYVDATQSALIAAAYYFHKPVVVTRAGVLPEYVEDGLTGRVVEADYPVALARCLEEMLSDSGNLSQMGAAGRAWYDRWRVEEMQLLIDMYQQLI